MKKLILVPLAAILFAMPLAAQKRNYLISFYGGQYDFGTPMETVLKNNSGWKPLEVGEDYIRYRVNESKEEIRFFHEGGLSAMSAHFNWTRYQQADPYQSFAVTFIGRDYPVQGEVQIGDYSGHTYADRGIITLRHKEKPKRVIYIIRSHEQVERDAPREEEVLTRYIAYWHQKNFDIDAWDEAPWPLGGILDYSDFQGSWNEIKDMPFRIERDSLPVPMVSDVGASVSGGRVTITWNDPFNLEGCAYRIFRIERSIDFNELGDIVGTVVQGRPLEYIDIPPPGEYEYSVMVELDGTIHRYPISRRSTVRVAVE